YPKLPKLPEVKVEILESRKVNFVCEFELIKGYDVEYEIEYYLGETSLFKDRLKDGIIPRLASNKITKITSNMQIKCSVVACFKDNCEGSQGPPSVGPGVNPGIQIITKSLTVIEGSINEMIKIKSNVPPSFFCGDDEDCEVRIMAGIRAAKEQKCPDKRVIPQAVIAWTGDVDQAPFCGVTLSKAKWNEYHLIAVKGVVDSLKDGDKNRVVEVWVSVITKVKTIKIELGQVKLKIKDGDKASICKSVNDPHITTFDG
ncbi:hypothetical protein LOTGIDRAFT_176337, partial [Lottia gigantea]